MARFSAQVSAAVADSKKLLESVFRESVQDLAQIMNTPGPSVANPTATGGGHMPIDSGFLAASLVATLDDVPPPSREKPPGDEKYVYVPGPVNLTAAQAKITDTITLAYTANYARYANHRYRFVDLAVQRWPQIVTANVVKLAAAIDKKARSV